MQYGNARGNYISSSYIHKNHPQDLLSVYQLLSLKEGPSFATEVVSRMAKLNKFRPEEISSIAKICEWPKNSFDKVLEVFRSFEKYETVDVNKKANAKKIVRGDKLTLSNVLFNKLAKCNETRVRGSCDKVLRKEISFESMIESCHQSVKTAKVLDVLKQVSGFKSTEELTTNFPEITSPEILSKYVGAEIRGDKLNTSAVLLKEYWKRLSENLPTEKDEVSFQYMDHFNDCRNHFNKYDHVIFQSSKPVGKLLSLA